MKSIEECQAEVARKHGLGNSLVTGHKASYFREAAQLYALQVIDEIEGNIWDYTEGQPDEYENESSVYVNHDGFNKLKEKIKEQ